MKLFKFILYLIAVLVSFEILAEPALKIENAWVGATEEGGDMSVAYMSLLSHEDLILTSVTSQRIKTITKNKRPEIPSHYHHKRKRTSTS